jgi:hypothetical protein
VGNTDRLGDLRRRLAAAQDPVAEFRKEGGSFVHLIDRLHDFSSQKVSFLSDDFLIPLTAIAEELDKPFDTITQPILHRLVDVLIENIRRKPQHLEALLHQLHPFLHNPVFCRIFEEIVLLLKPLPDYFLLELLQLPPPSFSSVFPAGSPALFPLFSQSRPLFHRVVLSEIEHFCLDPIPLDTLLNSIRVRVKPRRQNRIKASSIDFSFSIRVEGRQTLSRKHHEVCSGCVKALLEYCCNSQLLFDELCCILRDLWERTQNPLLCALRLELGFASQTNDNLTDPTKDFAVTAFHFCDDNSGFSRRDAVGGGRNIRFAAADPLLRYLLYCVMLRNVLTRVSKREYVRFDERDNLNIILQSLAPGTPMERLEDIANNIEAMMLAAELARPSDDIVADLKRDASAAPHVLMFAGFYLLVSRSDGALLNAVADPPPDVAAAVLMAKWVLAMGLSAPNADQLLRILMGWAKNDRFVFLYLLALFDRIGESRHDLDVVAEAFEEIEEWHRDLGNVEQSIVASIRQTVENYRGLLRERDGAAPGEP